jgi:hypothetical protein
MSKLVTGNARVINPRDQAAPGNPVRATAIGLPWWQRLAGDHAAAPVNLPFIPQYRLDPVRPASIARWRLKGLLTRKATYSRRQSKIRRTHARP